MKKSDLESRVSTTKSGVKSALLTLYNVLNSGQQKKVLKDEAVAALFEQYGVLDEEDEEPTVDMLG